MTKLLTVAFGMVAAALVGVHPAHADALNITYLTQVCATASATSGGVSDSDGGCVNVPSLETATALAGSSSATSLADLITYNIGPNGFRAALSTEATALSNTLLAGEQATGQGNSLFNLSFDLTVPHTYEFVGEVTLLGTLTNGSPSGEVSFTGPGVSFSTFGGVPVVGLGVLMPGAYLITVHSQSDAFTSSGGFPSSIASSVAAFDLHMLPGDGVTAIPEPTSIILLGTGLIAALGRQRRRRGGRL
jgi:hypothetical protein